jgi:predicted SAM-dependent methyltransferase
VAIEGHKKTADMLTKEKLYDEVHQIFIQDWISSTNKEVFDLAIFGDVLEHLEPKEIRRVIDQCIRFFKEIIVICPLYDIFQDDSYRNPVEVHQTYITSTFFDRYNPVEKHIIRGEEWIIMNVCILSTYEQKPLYRRLSWFAFHKCMLILQPIGLARPFVNFLKRFFIKYKWLLRD